MTTRIDDRWSGITTPISDTLGPGHYFGPVISDPREKRISFSIGQQRPLLEQPEILAPGPGTYSPDKGMAVAWNNAYLHNAFIRFIWSRTSWYWCSLGSPEISISIWNGSHLHYTVKVIIIIRISFGISIKAWSVEKRSRWGSTQVIQL